MARKRRANARDEAWSHCSTDRWLDDGLCCGIRRFSGGRALGSGTRRRSQHWDRLRDSGLHRSARLCATCLLRSTPGLLQRTLCRLLRTLASIQASLSPGTPLSSLLLLLLIPPCMPRRARSALPPIAFASGYDSGSSLIPRRPAKLLETPRPWPPLALDRRVPQGHLIGTATSSGVFPASFGSYQSKTPSDL
jgi:hypothetical protein